MKILHTFYGVYHKIAISQSTVLVINVRKEKVYSCFKPHLESFRVANMG